MKFSTSLIILTLLAFPLAGIANLEITLSTEYPETATKTGETNSSVLTLKAKNGFEQGIRNARVAVFVFDGDPPSPDGLRRTGGKIVGTRSLWLSDYRVPEMADGRSEMGDSSAGVLLEADDEAEYTFAVEYSGEGVETKVVFMRIILEDGSLVNPQKSVVEADAEDGR